MIKLSASSELSLIKWACYAFTFVSILFTLLVAAYLFLKDSQVSFRAYLLLIYSTGLTFQSIRASLIAHKESELPRTLRYLSICVIAMSILGSLIFIYSIWFSFQPVH